MRKKLEALEHNATTEAVSKRDICIRYFYLLLKMTCLKLLHPRRTCDSAAPVCWKAATEQFVSMSEKNQYIALQAVELDWQRKCGISHAHPRLLVKPLSLDNASKKGVKRKRKNNPENTASTPHWSYTNNATTYGPFYVSTAASVLRQASDSRNSQLFQVPSELCLRLSKFTTESLYQCLQRNFGTLRWLQEVLNEDSR
jgi:hypothetical protein